MRRPACGERFQIEPGKFCQVLCYAEQRRKSEELLVYQELFGDFRIYAESPERICGWIESGNEKRFLENFDPGFEKSFAAESEPEQGFEGDLSESPDPLLMAFLDADSMEEKYNILMKAHNKSNGRVSENFLSAAAFSIDCVLPEESAEERFQALKYFLMTKRRYESRRFQE